MGIGVNSRVTYVPSTVEHPRTRINEYTYPSDLLMLRLKNRSSRNAALSTLISGFESMPRTFPAFEQRDKKNMHEEAWRCPASRNLSLRKQKRERGALSKAGGRCLIFRGAEVHR